jgi:hypothetical protein
VADIALGRMGAGFALTCLFALTYLQVQLKILVGRATRTTCPFIEVDARARV